MSRFVNTNPIERTMFISKIRSHKQRFDTFGGNFRRMFFQLIFKVHFYLYQ